MKSRALVFVVCGLAAFSASGAVGGDRDGAPQGAEADAPLVVVDGLGEVVGVVLDTSTSSALLVHRVAGMDLLISARRKQLIGTARMYFESEDCEGVPLLSTELTSSSTSNGRAWALTTARRGPLWYRSQAGFGPRPRTQVLSVWRDNRKLNQSGCTSVSRRRLVLRVVPGVLIEEVDLSGFTPRFSLRGGPFDR